MRRALCAFGLAVLFFQLASFRAEAAAERRQVAWSDLQQQVGGRKVQLVLPDGVSLEGRVNSVESDALVMSIQKSSDPKKYAKGPASIPRSQVSALSFTETSGRWRALGTAIGAGAGGAAGAVAGKRFTNEGNDAAAGGLTAVLGGAGAAVGYFAGRGADRKVVTLVINN